MSIRFGKQIRSICMGMYWTQDKAKEILQSTYRIGETLFTSTAIIGGKIYSNHPKNLNNVYKDTKDMVSVIINLGNYISGGDTVFYDGVKTSDLGSRAHSLKCLHGRMIFGPFEKKSMKVLFGEDMKK